MVPSNINTKTLYQSIASVSTPKGQKRTAHPYSKVVHRGLYLGTTLGNVGTLPLSRYLAGDGEPIPGWSGTFSPVSRAKEICRRRIISKLRGDTASWGMNMVEYKQSLQTIATALNVVRKPMTTIGDAFQRYAKATRKSGRTLPNMQLTKKRAVAVMAGMVTTDMIGAHLAYKFGVAPVMEDIKSTMTMLETMKQIRRQIVASSGARPFACSIVEADPIYGAIKSLQGTTRCRTGASFILTNECLYDAENLGLYNLPAIALDAIPLSFIVNWFWPVVTWAKSLSAFAGVTPVDCWTTVRREGIGEDKRKRQIYDELYGSYIESFYMNRTLELVTSMPFPTEISVVSDKELGKTFSALEIAAQRLIPTLLKLKG